MEVDTERPGTDRPVRRRDAPRRVAALLLVAVGVVSAAGCVVLAVAHARSVEADTDRRDFLQAARQAVLNVTTMSADTVDVDVERLRASSAGAFLADFDTRAEEYASTVRSADVVSVGEVVEAGIESVDGETARVLVRATSTVTNAAGAQEQPRTWRLRVTVQRTEDGVRMADLEYVP